MHNLFDRLEIIDEQGGYHVPDPDLIELAGQIVDAYVRLRPNYIPGRVNVGRKLAPKFYAAAQLCRERELTAPVFVAKQLAGMALTGSFWPSGIANPKFMESLMTHQESLDQTDRHYKSQLTVLAARTRIYGLHLTLLDETVQLTPLMRAAVGYANHMHDVVGHYRAAAKVELESTPRAREIFSEHLGFL